MELNKIQKQLFASSCRQMLPADTTGFQRACGTISDKEGLELILGQYWHLLHYFPTFLSGLTFRAPQLAFQTYISKILSQELGDGMQARAHEVLFLSTVTACGLNAQKISSAPANQATRDLLAAFQDGTGDFYKGLGVLFATEATDLAIVSSLADAIRRITGIKDLPWEAVHIEQEPDHVHCSTLALGMDLTLEEQNVVAESVSKTGLLWEGFFAGL